jgi:hypothetical protein
MPNEFKPNAAKSGKFEPLLQKNKKVNIKGEFDFSTNRLASPKASESNHLSSESTVKPIASTKRGRPVTIKDQRYKVSVPKKVSPALNSKLAVLEDYVTELQSETGRITFEKLVDTLVESYITKNLGMAKEEHIREEIKQKFDELSK